MRFPILEDWEATLLSLTQAPIRSEPAELDPFAEASDPSALHPPVQPVRLRWRVRVADAEADERFRYASPVESRQPRNDVVSGNRWRLPEARLSGTALILLHTAFVPNHRPQRLFAKTALQNGAHLFVLDLPYHIRRQPRASRFSGQYLISGDVPRLIRGVIQGAADVRTLVLTLRLALGYRRVLVAGLGLGGTVAALAAAREPVDGLFLAAPVLDPCRAIWGTPFGEVVRRAARLHGFPDEGVERAMRCITPLHLPPPATPRENVDVVYGAEDVLVPLPVTQAYLEHLGAPSSEELPLGHTLLAVRLPWIQRRLGRWVEEVTDRLPAIA